MLPPIRPRPHHPSFMRHPSGLRPISTQPSSVTGRRKPAPGRRPALRPARRSRRRTRCRDTDTRPAPPDRRSHPRERAPLVGALVAEREQPMLTWATATWPAGAPNARISPSGISATPPTRMNSTRNTTGRGAARRVAQRASHRARTADRWKQRDAAEHRQHDQHGAHGPGDHQAGQQGQEPFEPLEEPFGQRHADVLRLGPGRGSPTGSR